MTLRSLVWCTPAGQFSQKQWRPPCVRSVRIPLDDRSDFGIESALLYDQVEILIQFNKNIQDNTSVWLDVLRSLAAQAVVLGHTYQLFFFGSHAAPENQIEMILHNFIIFISKFSHEAVVVFFVISGYLVGGNALNAIRSGTFQWRDFLISRLTRLWVVLLPCLVITLMLDSASLNFGNGAYFISNWASMFPPGWMDADPWSISRFITNALFLARFVEPMYGTNMSLWSLTNEFWYYLLLPALLTLLTSKGKRLVFSIGILLVLGGLLSMVTNPISFLVFFAIWLLGAVLFYAQNVLRLSSTPLLLIMISFGIVALMPNLESQMLKDICLGIVSCAIISVSPYIASRWAQKPSKFIAGYSFSLYVMHLPFLVLLFSTDPKTAIVSPYGGYDLLRFVGYVIITNMFCIVFWYIFERHTDAIKRRLRRTAPRPISTPTVNSSVN